MSVSKVVLTMEGKIKFKLSYIEVISSLVTEMIGKETEDDVPWQVTKDRGTGMFVICVLTTEMSPKCGHTECRKKLSAFIEKGSVSHLAAKVTCTVDAVTMGEREKEPVCTECGESFVDDPCRKTEVHIWETILESSLRDKSPVCRDLGRKRFKRGVGMTQPHGKAACRDNVERGSFAPCSKVNCISLDDETKNSSIDGYMKSSKGPKSKQGKSPDVAAVPDGDHNMAPAPLERKSKVILVKRRKQTPNPVIGLEQRTAS